MKLVRTVRAHVSSGRLDRFELTLGAGLEGAVAQAVAEVSVIAETLEVVV